MPRLPKWISVLPLLFVLGLPAACSRSPVDRAKAFLDAGMASQAVPLLQVEIQSDPKNVRAHLLLGQASLMLNDQAAASESFDRALLLDPGRSQQVARAYLAAANKLLSGGPSDSRLAVSYLTVARGKTHQLDQAIAHSLRRAGLNTSAVDVLRLAIEADAALSKDDSVAACLAMDPTQDPDPRLQAMTRFLADYPKSALRPAMLLELARLEVAAGDRPKARAHAQEAAQPGRDPQVRDAANALLQDIAGAERSETDAREAAQQAQLQADQARARGRLLEQAAQARAAQAEAEARGARATAAAEARAHEVEYEAQRKAREAERAAARAAALEAQRVRLEGRLRQADGDYIDTDHIVHDNQATSGTFVAIRGRPRALSLHPISETEPAYVEREYYIPAGGATLVAEFCSSHQDCGPESDFAASLVAVDDDGGEHLLESQAVDYANGWIRKRIPLNDFANQVVRVRFVDASGGVKHWCSEWAALAAFYVLR